MSLSVRLNCLRTVARMMHDVLNYMQEDKGGWEVGCKIPDDEKRERVYHLLQMILQNCEEVDTVVKELPDGVKVVAVYSTKLPEELPEEEKTVPHKEESHTEVRPSTTPR